MNTVRIPDPQDQPSFRQIHFAARQLNGDVRIFVWESLAEAVHTLKKLVPELRQFLTAEHVRGLAAPSWDQFYADMSYSHDEFAALWFAKVVYDPGITFPDQLEDLYDANGAAIHAKRLRERQGQERSFIKPHSEWECFVKKFVTYKQLPVIPKHPAARQELMLDAKPCKDCDVPPIGLDFPHASPNWIIYCPCCDMSTDPREGWSRAMALEAWNKWN